MTFNKSSIEGVIEAHFFHNIYSEISSYVSDLDSFDLSDYFDEDVEFAEVDGIDVENLSRYEVNHIEDEIEINGSLEVEVTLSGYTYWEGDNHCVDSSVITMEVSFVYYQVDEEPKDFEITDFFI